MLRKFRQATHISAVPLLILLGLLAASCAAESGGGISSYNTPSKTDPAALELKVYLDSSIQVAPDTPIRVIFYTNKSSTIREFPMPPPNTSGGSANSDSSASAAALPFRVFTMSSATSVHMPNSSSTGRSAGIESSASSVGIESSASAASSRNSTAAASSKSAANSTIAERHLSSQYVACIIPNIVNHPTYLLAWYDDDGSGRLKKGQYIASSGDGISYNTLEALRLDGRKTNTLQFLLDDRYAYLTYTLRIALTYEKETNENIQDRSLGVSLYRNNSFNNAGFIDSKFVDSAFMDDKGSYTFTFSKLEEPIIYIQAWLSGKGSSRYQPGTPYILYNASSEHGVDDLSKASRITVPPDTTVFQSIVLKFDCTHITFPEQ
ncbi:MAG: hypothetical protein LBC99_10025 [Spirochaetota bacterium]|jgi:hypothetical protein|nr:hypothetical protein [Spirochaetota bacterium]